MQPPQTKSHLFNEVVLGTLGGSYSAGYSLNEAGQVVGTSALSSDLGQHAFLYSHGQMMDLNNLIDPAPGIMLGDARDINDQGQILATGDLSSGEPHAFLLTPIPEPSTLALFGVALLGLAAWARRHTAHP